MNTHLFQLPLEEAERFITDCVRRAIESMRLTTQAITSDATAETNSAAGSQLLRTSDVCRLLRISKPTCAQWRKEGKLKFYRVGRFVYFREKEVLAALRNPHC